MAAEIERIVDRKNVRNRVQYLVVWRGFGEESNTWETRLDLVADGYSDVIRAYENSRKGAEHEAAANGDISSRSPSRGRSPNRSAKKSASAKSPSKSPGRPRGRPRSNSTGRSPSASRRRSSSKGRDSGASNGNGTDSEASTPSRRRSSRKHEPAEETKHGDDELLKATLTALDHTPSRRGHAHTETHASYENGEKKTTTTVQLAYEETTATVLTEENAATPTSPSKAIATKEPVDADAAGLQDLWHRLNEGNWLVWFVSVVVVAASLLASQFLSDADDTVAGVVPGGRDVEAAQAQAQALASQWRLWLPFLTPIVALLLVLHQRDERSLAKWVAIALSWRVAAELSMFFEFAQVAIGTATVSYTALVVALVSIARSDSVRSQATLVVFVVGALALALSDSWIVQTQNVALSSRVSLMSASALAIALSPVLTATTAEEE